MILELSLTVTLLIALSAFFSASETAFSCLNRARIKNMVAKGDKSAARVAKLNDHFDKLISTILIGNNIVNIASATVATLLFSKLVTNPDLAATVSTVVMTILVLIFGEVLPKSLAKEQPEKMAMLAAPPLLICRALFTPFNWFFSQLKMVLDRLLKSDGNRSLTGEELKTMVEESTSEGVIDSSSGDLIKSAIEFNDVAVRHILTPRVDVVAVDIHDSLEQIQAVFLEHEFSRLPVFDGTIDHVVGVIHHRSFQSSVIAGDLDFADAVQTVLYIPASMKISVLLQKMQQEMKHMAIVVDEFGGTRGVVTLEDVLEVLVGEIWDESDETVEVIKAVDDENFRVLGATKMSRFQQFFHLAEPETPYESVSVSGWIGEWLDSIPERGSSFHYQHLEITVKAMDERRIREIAVRHLTPVEQENDQESSDAWVPPEAG